MNHYEIIEEIGRGAMGIVYKAKDIKLDRIVALKELLLAPHVNSQEKQQMVDRFYREARSAGKLSHSNIVTIYDVGEEDGRYFIAMEFLAGQSLANMLEQGVILDTEQAINIICQVGEALDCAHREGIVHRDIKPANIMIMQDGRVKVADFGIARAASSSTMTQTGAIIGSPGYMPPEQIAGQKVDGRADIFSLGVILYQLMTGEKPFAGDIITTIIYKIVNQEPVPPRSVNIQISQRIEQIILRALAKDPAMRYQTVREMIEDLRNPERAANWAQAAVQQTPEQTVFIGTSSSSTQIPIHQESPQISYKEPEKAKKIFPVFAGIAGILVVVMGFSVWMLTKQNDSNRKTFPPPPKKKIIQPKKPNVPPTEKSATTISKQTTHQIFQTTKPTQVQVKQHKQRKTSISLPLPTNDQAEKKKQIHTIPQTDIKNPDPQPLPKEDPENLAPAPTAPLPKKEKEADLVEIIDKNKNKEKQEDKNNNIQEEDLGKHFHK